MTGTVCTGAGRGQRARVIQIRFLDRVHNRGAEPYRQQNEERDRGPQPPSRARPAAPMALVVGVVGVVVVMRRLRIRRPVC